MSQDSASPIHLCIQDCQLTPAGSRTHAPRVFSCPFKVQQAPGCQGTNGVAKVTTCWQRTMERNPRLSKVHVQTHKHKYISYINVKRIIEELNMGKKTHT